MIDSSSTAATIKLEEIDSNETTQEKQELSKDTSDTSAPKAKRRKSLKDSQLKIKILELIDQGAKVNSLANEYNVGASTIRDWMKCREKIFELDNLNKTCNLSKKTLKLSDYPQVDKALCIWYYQQRALNRPVTAATTCEKAKYFKQYLDLDKTKTTFSASHGFVSNFFLRHGFKVSKKNGEIETELTSELFKQQIKEQIEQEKYKSEQIFTLEEAGLFWHCLPNENFGPTSKDRIHFAMTYNCAGTFRLPLIIVNKSKIYDKNKSNISLAIYFAEHYKALLSQNLLEEWFHQEFVPKVEEYLKSINSELKAILLIENFAQRECLKSTSGLIKCIFRPPNTVALIDQLNFNSPLTWMKKAYKHDLIREIFVNDKDKEFLKNYSIRKCMNFMALNWLKIPTLVLKSSWQKYDLNQDDSITNSELDLNELIQLAKQLDFKEEEIKSWIASDLYDNGFGILSDSEIINQVLAENSLQADKIDENNKINDSPEEVSVISCTNALKYVDSILSWLETQKNLDPSFILKALELRDLACQKMVENDTNALISNSVLINQIKETYSESKSEYIQGLSKMSQELRDEIIGELAEPFKKRHKVVLENDVRIEILKQVDDGKKINDLAAEYGCGATTIRDWIKIKDKIMEKSLPGKRTHDQIQTGTNDNLLGIISKKRTESLKGSSNKINKILAKI